MRPVCQETETTAQGTVKAKSKSVTTLFQFNPEVRHFLNSMIRAENLTKSFGDQILFEGIGFSINHRQRVGLVGKNGHGKTTLFRLIAGEEQPDSGSIVIPKS